MDARERASPPQVIVVMGVAGAGKTTVGKCLARALGWAYLEGDELHPPANIAKMRRGLPLTDADRDPWLNTLRARIEALLAANQPAVVACSALRRRYRARLRVNRQVCFVHLAADYPLLRERLQGRRGHFVAPSLLDSQLGTLEKPKDALAVDAALPVEEIVTRIRAAFGI